MKKDQVNKTTTNPSTFQPFNPSTFQPFNPSTLQPFNPSTFQPFNPSTLQPFNPSTFQLFIFCVSAILAIILYKQRTYLDNSYYLFHVINEGAFRIEHQRIILAFSQALPWLAVKLHAPLQIILVLNSLNPVVYFFLIFCIIKFWISDEMMAISLLFVHAIVIPWFYFSPMYEIYYGCGMLILFYALLKNDMYKSKLGLAAIIVVSLLVFFSHPLVVVSYLFLVLYHFIHQEKRNYRYLLLFLFLLMIPVVVKWQFSSSYESNKFSTMSKFLTAGAYTDTFSAANLGSVLRAWLYHYGIVLVLLIVTCIYFIRKKLYSRFILFFLFFVGSIFLINITQAGMEASMYYEMLVPVVISIFFCEVFCKGRKFSALTKFIYPVLFTILTFVLVLPVINGKSFLERSKNLRSLIYIAQKEDKGSKLCITNKISPVPEWSLPMESLLLSSMGKEKKSITLCNQEDIDFENNEGFMVKENFILRRWEIQLNSDLNPEYFNLKEENYRDIRF